VTLSSGGVGGTGTSGPILNALGPGSVAGIGAYAFYKDSLYFELSAYHSAVAGGNSPTIDSVSLAANGGAVDRFAPYARIAYERDWGLPLRGDRRQRPVRQLDSIGRLHLRRSNRRLPLSR